MTELSNSDRLQAQRVTDYARRKGIEGVLYTYECRACFRQEAYIGPGWPDIACPECGAKDWRYLKEPMR